MKPPRSAPTLAPDALEDSVLPDVLIAVTALPGTLAWRSNSGLLLSPDGKRRVRANIPGLGDVTGVRAVLITPEMVGTVIGEAFTIETKRAIGGKQRESQERLEIAWRAAGGRYVLARSGAQAVAGLNEKRRK